MDKRNVVTCGQWIALAFIAMSIAPATGCRLCADCEDLAYPAYGGAWQRTIRDSGRVGSVFDPAGGKAPDLSDRDLPPSPDELERERHSGRNSGPDDPSQERDGDSMERNDDGEAAPNNDLRSRQLDDINEDKEEELRSRDLDDIKVRRLPSQPMPPQLQ